MERNIQQYQDTYDNLPFEEYQVLYRRKKVLEQINERGAHCILEIGCGNLPLYKDDQKGREWIIVEPGKRFYEKAKSEAPSNVYVFCDYFEDCTEKILNLNKKIDYIVCSALLHELEKPENMLNSICNICDQDTIVHIDVPNAKSIHRLLAMEMGIIPDIYTVSQQAIKLQQQSVYDKRILRNLCEENALQVINEGSYFVKPFTHRQMQDCLDYGIFDRRLLDGLDRLIRYMPEYGSEIFVECRKK